MASFLGVTDVGTVTEDIVVAHRVIGGEHTAHTHFTGIDGTVYFVITQSIVGGMGHGLCVFIAGIHGTGESVVHHDRGSRFAAHIRVAGFGTIAEHAVVANRIVRIEHTPDAGLASVGRAVDVVIASAVVRGIHTALGQAARSGGAFQSAGTQRVIRHVHTLGGIGIA